MIQCNADGYKYKFCDNRIYVFNGVYESKRWLILLAALLEAFLPDNNTFRVPIAICIKNTGKDVNKKLEVLGDHEYEYFIPKEHFAKWKYTYALVYQIIAFVVMASTLISFYIFLFKSQFNLAIGLIVLLLAVSSIIICTRMYRQRSVIRKYAIKSMS